MEWMDTHRIPQQCFFFHFVAIVPAYSWPAVLHCDEFTAHQLTVWSNPTEHRICVLCAYDDKRVRILTHAQCSVPDAAARSSKFTRTNHQLDKRL